MSRYIDADAFEAFGYTSQNGTFDDGVQFVLEKIDEQPTADVIPSKYGCGNAPYCSDVWEVDEDE